MPSDLEGPAYVKITEQDRQTARNFIIERYATRDPNFMHELLAMLGLDPISTPDSADEPAPQ